ncbi:hypothetical protein [Paraliobacillus ryukyuensis]|uniref:hypothetical protein n=1 Tax=Paraliobacillus ryukyuensis TaxID=200904 RepID=UPI0009A5E1F4|nr:hypothetical protein [Paraliobacillus ryukyuensis]
MTVNEKSKILSIEEQIKKLQEKKKREIAKLEKNTGKKFIQIFELEDKSSEEIYNFIEKLKEMYRSNNENMGESNNEQSDQ